MLALLLLSPLALADGAALMSALRQTPVAPDACQRALALPAPPRDCELQSRPHGVLVVGSTACAAAPCAVVGAVVRADGVHPLPTTIDGTMLLGGATLLLPGARAVLTDRLRPGEAAGSWLADTARIDVETGAVHDFVDCFSAALGPDGRTLTCRDRAGALLRTNVAGVVPEVVRAGPGPAAVDWAPRRRGMPGAATWLDEETVAFTIVGPGGERPQTHTARVPPRPRPPGLEAWVEVPTTFSPGPGLRGADRVFVHTTGGCLPGRMAAEQVEVQLCRTADATCTWRHDAADRWTPSWSQSCVRPDGSGWGAGGGGSLHDPPRIVRDDAEAIEWAHAPTIEATPRTERYEERPCTPESAAAGTDHGRGPARRCHMRQGLSIAPRVRWGGQGVGIAWRPEPVDCRTPCPPDPDGARVAAASAWLAGRRFVAQDAPRIGIYATEKGCQEAPHASLLTLDLHACEGAD